MPAWAAVWVVDNDSADGTADAVKAAFPFVTLLQAGSNLGFSRANNLAIRRTSSKYVLLLNPDTLVSAGALERLVDEMEASPAIGTVAPRQLSRTGAVQFEAGVNLPDVWNGFCDLALLSRVFPHSRIFNRRLMGWWDHKDDRDVAGVAGSAMLLRRAALDRVGLLDETMFCGEDMDMCRRLAADGWRIRYLASATITHFGGESVKRSNAGLQRQIAYQSFWLYLRKHDGRFMAAAMAASVFMVASIGWTATAVGRWLPGVPENVRGAMDRYHALTRALLAWSVTNKGRFRHQLAAPPGRVVSRSVLAVARHETGSER